MPENQSHKGSSLPQSYNLAEIVSWFSLHFQLLFSSLEEVRAHISQISTANTDFHVRLLEINERLAALPMCDTQESPFISIEDAADELSCCKRTITRYGDKGELELVKRGRFVRVTRKSLQAFIDRHTDSK